MKMYKAPTIESVELNIVDVIAVSGGEAKGINTGAYNLKATTKDGTTLIKHSNQGEEWQSNWN